MQLSNLYSNQSNDSPHKIERQFAKYLRDRVCDLDYGLLHADYNRGKHPIFANGNVQVRQFLQRDRRYVTKMNYDCFHRHFSGENTFYFQGTGRKAEMLFMFDIDVGKSQNLGSWFGAWKCAKYLQSQFANLYVEPSTNGDGVHGFAILKTEGKSNQEINKALKHLESVLQKCVEWFDIELIEIKGHAPEITWSKYVYGRVSDYKAGQLAKFPRQAWRLEQLENTTRLTCNEIYALQLSQPEIHAESAWDRQDARPAKKNMGNEKPDCPAGSRGGQYRVPRIRVGSTTSQPFTSEVIDQCRLAAKKLINVNRGRPLHKRLNIVREDIAIFLALLVFFKENPNADGSLPTKRIEYWWSVGYQSGAIDRAYNSERVAKIRSLLSQHHLIDVKDDTYFFFEDGDKKGQAMKYGANEELIALINGSKDNSDKGEASFAQSQILAYDPNAEFSPCLVTHDHRFYIDMERANEIVCANWQQAA